MFYFQYMGVAVVISFVRALEMEIPLGGNFTPRWLRTGVKKGGYMRVKAQMSRLRYSLMVRPRPILHASVSYTYYLYSIGLAAWCGLQST